MEASEQAMTSKICRICKDALVVGQNWGSHYFRTNRYICIKCERARAKEYHKNHAEDLKANERKYTESLKVEAICVGCNKKFMASRRNKNQPQRYCSKSCWYQRNDIGGSKSKICGRCGKTFSKIKQGWRDWNVQKFCSLRCAYDAMPPAARPQKTCETCHIEFFKHKNISSKTWARQRFCSPKCRANSPESKELLRKNGRLMGARNAKLGYLPSMSSMAGKIGGKKGGLINGRKNAESGQIQALGRKYGPINGRKNGHVNGMKNVESGRIFDIPRASISYGLCGIMRHKHRSKLEVWECLELQKVLKQDEIHSCVVFKRKEIDFVIGADEKDQSSWQRVIEIHSPHWDEYHGIKDYKTERTAQLIQIGVTCPIEVIIARYKRISNKHLRNGGVTN